MSVANVGFSSIDYYRQPLSPTVRRGVLVLVVLFHVGGGWALTRIQPARLVVGEAPPMEVRMVAAEPPSSAERLISPPPDDTPPPPPEPQLESMIQPPPPDLPPPAFPVQAPPPALPKPKQPPPKAKPLPVPAPAAPPVQSAAPPPPSQPAAPKAVAASQVSYLSPPRPIYPANARRAGETGTVTLRVLIDPTGRPDQVLVQTPSGHSALDQSALSAVRAARFRPYIEAGIPQAVWVQIPINFVLQ